MSHTKQQAPETVDVSDENIRVLFYTEPATETTPRKFRALVQFWPQGGQLCECKLDVDALYGLNGEQTRLLNLVRKAWLAGVEACGFVSEEE